MKTKIIDAMTEKGAFSVDDMLHIAHVEEEQPEDLIKAIVKAVALGDHGLLQYLLDLGCLAPNMDDADWKKIIEDFLGLDPQLSVEKMDKTIEERIEELREDARNKNIYREASLIADKLGKVSPKKHGAYHNFSEGDLTISWDDYAPNLSITWMEQRVFTVHLGTIIAYRPDVEGWIEQLECRYLKVVPLFAQDTEARDRKRAEELGENWGIEI